MPKLRNGNNGDSNPGSLDCESGILPTELPRSTKLFIQNDHLYFPLIANEYSKTFNDNRSRLDNCYDSPNMKRMMRQFLMCPISCRMHLHNETLKGEDGYVDKFGFHTPTCCGYLAQDNTWTDDWVVGTSWHVEQLISLFSLSPHLSLLLLSLSPISPSLSPSLSHSLSLPPSISLSLSVSLAPSFCPSLSLSLSLSSSVFPSLSLSLSPSPLSLSLSLPIPPLSLSLAPSLSTSLYSSLSPHHPYRSCSSFRGENGFTMQLPFG